MIYIFFYLKNMFWIFINIKILFKINIWINIYS